MVAPVLDRHMEVTTGVAGGKPRITGRRITVQNIVVWHEHMGLNADEIASAHDLTLADVYAALAYYFDYRAEIDASIRDDAAFVAALRLQQPSRLHARLDALSQ